MDYELYGHIIGIYSRSGEGEKGGGGEGGKRERRKGDGEKKCKEDKVK